MLSRLQIRDYAIVDDCEIEFEPGMTVLTGETGAGKSIAIDALAVALGGRADTSSVRAGAKRAEITAGFELSTLPQVLTWLRENDLDEDAECVVRRTVAIEGASRAYVNGRQVPVQMLRTLGDMLVDIHSQHQHQLLLQRDSQRHLLDAYAGVEPLVAEIEVIYKRCQKLQQELDELSQAASERDARAEFLRFQSQELERLDLRGDEWISLEREHTLLANSERIQQALHTALAILDESDVTLSGQLDSAQHALASVLLFQPHVEVALQHLDAAAIQIGEAVAAVRRLARDTDLDPDRIRNIEDRMGAILDAARKHRCEPDQLPELAERFAQELASIENADNTISDLTDQVGRARRQFDTVAAKLRKERQAAAGKLGEVVTNSLARLGMGGAKFIVTLEPLPAGEMSAYGSERILFEVSTNPGQPAKPLAKTASGGELSRISLAIQVATAQVARIPTLIFDEVDVGIGGRVAEIVGELLKSLAATRQVICITHQAQVAAQGRTHLQVQKLSDGATTRTGISALTPEDRVAEIARMIGGVEITQATRDHAKEMLQRAGG